MNNRLLYITYMGLTEPLLYSQALTYLKGLSQKGNLVYLLSFEKKEFFTPYNISRVKQDLNSFKIKWFFLKYHKRPQFLAKPYDITKGIFYSSFIIIKYRIKIVHVRNTICALMGILPKILFKKKMIFDLRGLMAEEYVDAGLWKRDSFVYRVCSALERYFLKKADEIVVLTHKIRDILSDDYKFKKITVIPTCVDLNRFNFNHRHNYDFKDSNSADNRFNLIYVGSIGTWYMFSAMIDFFQKLLQVEKNASFSILSQTEKRVIEQEIPPELRKYVNIASALSMEVPGYLNLASVGIYFIKPCYSKLASCPTKLGEYLACGLPVIINGGIGDTGEIVQENNVGVIVERFDIEEYERKINKLKELLKEGNILRERCRKTAEKYFSLKDGIEKYQTIYSRIS